MQVLTDSYGILGTPTPKIQALLRSYDSHMVHLVVWGYQNPVFDTKVFRFHTQNHRGAMKGCRFSQMGLSHDFHFDGHISRFCFQPRHGKSQVIFRQRPAVSFKYLQLTPTVSYYAYTAPKPYITAPPQFPCHFHFPFDFPMLWPVFPLNPAYPHNPNIALHNPCIALMGLTARMAFCFNLPAASHPKMTWFRA